MKHWRRGMHSSSWSIELRNRTSQVSRYEYCSLRMSSLHRTSCQLWSSTSTGTPLRCKSKKRGLWRCCALSTNQSRARLIGPGSGQPTTCRSYKQRTSVSSQLSITSQATTPTRSSVATRVSFSQASQTTPMAPIKKPYSSTMHWTMHACEYHSTWSIWESTNQSLSIPALLLCRTTQAQLTSKLPSLSAQILNQK